MLSVPNGDRRWPRRCRQLDLLVSLDLYVNETNRHADYVLPATTFLERDDMPYGLAASSPTVFMQATEAVLDPYGEARRSGRSSTSSPAGWACRCCAHRSAGPAQPARSRWLERARPAL